VKQLTLAEIERLFDESVIAKTEYSTSELSRMWTEMHFGPVTGFVGPGPDNIGRVPLRALGYMRTSKGIYEESTSIIRQAESLIELGNRLNMKVVGLYADPDTPGYDIHSRGGLMRSVLGLQGGLADGLLVDEPSRVGRDGSLGYVHSLIARQRIPIIDARTGRAMDKKDVALQGLQSATEVQNLGHRTRTGKTIKAIHHNEATKRCVYAYFRRYPGGPIVKDKMKAEVVVEIHELYDAGWKIAHIVTCLNAKWQAGEKKYKPPGKAKFWQRAHLDGRKEVEVGILRYRDYIGEFWQNKTDNNLPNSRLEKQTVRPREKWICVNLPKLAFLDPELFKRNNERLNREAEVASLHQKACDEEKKKRGLSPGRVYGSNGNGRRLLSGVVYCGHCNVHKYHQERRQGRITMHCSGNKNGNCERHYSLDAERLESIVIDALEAEMSSNGVMYSYQQEIEAKHNVVLATIVMSKSEIDAEIERLSNELADLLVEMAPLSGRAREVYEARRLGVLNDLDDAAKRKALSELPNAELDLLRGVDLQKCRTLLERLKDPRIYLSKDHDDLYIVEMVRSMLKVWISPNEHDYGATATVTFDLSKFFDGPIVKPDLKRTFKVDLAPKEIGFRSPPRLDVDVSMFDEPDRHRIKDAAWEEVLALLKPHLNKKLKFFGARMPYDAIFLCLKAGAGPCSVLCKSYSYKRLSATHSHIRRRGLWPSILAILRKHGETWVDDLSPVVTKYLGGVGGERNVEWTVSKTVSEGRPIRRRPADDGASASA